MSRSIKQPIIKDRPRNFQNHKFIGEQLEELLIIQLEILKIILMK